MHNARVSEADKNSDVGDPDVTPAAIVADAPAASAELDEQASSSPSPPPPPTPPPSSAEEAAAAAGEKGGDGEGAGAGAGAGAEPFPIVLYGNGSDLDEVSRLLDPSGLILNFCSVDLRCRFPLRRFPPCVRAESFCSLALLSRRGSLMGESGELSLARASVGSQRKNTRLGIQA